MGLFLIGFYNKTQSNTMNKNELQLMTCKAGYSVVYNSRENAQITDAQLQNLQKNWGKVDYKGTLSKQTSRRIAHILQVWARTLYVNQYKNNPLGVKKNRNLVFITLTLSKKQTHDDLEIKRLLLNKFLIYMNRLYGMKNYLWKAEKQKNGNLHFHIITDTFINKHELNYEWDCIQYSHGYFSFKPFFVPKYESPSTRVEAVHSGEGVYAYMAKYVAKGDENGKVKGRIWGCSKSVRELEDYTFTVDSELLYNVEVLLKSQKVEMRVHDYCIIFTRDLFFNLYHMCRYHRSKINMVYASNYHRLYSNSDEFELATI